MHGSLQPHIPLRRGRWPRSENMPQAPHNLTPALSNARQLLIKRVFSAGCVPIFVVTDNKHTFGAVLNRAIRTVEGCRAACVADMGCFAIDYDTRYQACWLQRNANKSLFVAIDVNNHRVVRCPASK